MSLKYIFLLFIVILNVNNVSSQSDLCGLNGEKHERICLLCSGGWYVNLSKT